MAKNPWILVAIALTTAGAIAAAAPRSTTTPTTDTPPARIETRGPVREQICTDAKLGETLGGDPNGCREYLDACLDELTAAQRAQWQRSVDACLDDTSHTLSSCYVQVPWC